MTKHTEQRFHRMVTLALEGKRQKEIASEVKVSDGYVGRLLVTEGPFKRILLTSEECALIAEHRARQGIIFQP